MRLRDRVGLSEAAQHRLTWLTEVGLVAILGVGLYLGHTGVVVNAGIALLVAQLPPILERDYNIPMDVGLTLWITGAVFLHAVGTVPLPAEVVDLVGTAPAGERYATLYRSGDWWDHLTHALSASVVAAVGYATARALDEHVDSVHLPAEFMFVYILMFVLAFGVFWEVVEFVIGEVAVLFGMGSVLTQYGLGDTMKDLMFNTLGGVIVALWGTAYLTAVADAIGRRFAGRSESG
ncbi:hypothetical protein BRC94_10505 [Halobacteriales archaeon QS_5_70_17]|nr:MAG: hypothetical protein BRC94_10505 [Halobacteriales archaeon QS_5_70_17]